MTLAKTNCGVTKPSSRRIFGDRNPSFSPLVAHDPELVSEGSPLRDTAMPDWKLLIVRFGGPPEPCDVLQTTCPDAIVICGGTGQTKQRLQSDLEDHELKLLEGAVKDVLGLRSMPPFLSPRQKYLLEA
jgi:hypothetical protein